ncbi:DegV family protein [Paenibacillus sediminis]|uniref:DegV family protein with EDD domain n=1 Tax=Paenibacillus sediminis TaxID=664909 RepID=A0ABS4H5P3_9BACL|nr:DegV family protein [Paenibacillus sediminis]MBP1937853.1 DegV family protein with EDD domain [Paenibacillus sediminis]
MPQIKIFADSTSDLPKDWIRKYNIGIVPLYVVFGDKSFRDGVDMTPEDLYRKVDERGSLPNTAAPSPADFLAAFQPYIDQGDQILYISLSSEISSTYQNAVIAAGEFPEGTVTVFDSLNVCSAFGLLVMKAVRAAEEGKSVPEIVELLQAVRPQIKSEILIDTLEYLYKGGRLSGMQNLIGSLLKIRPIVNVVNGKLNSANKVRGKREKALIQILQNTLSNRDEMDNDLIFVAHTMAEEDAKWLQSKLQEETSVREVAISEAGCVISSHCGPKTIAIFYAKKVK